MIIACEVLSGGDTLVVYPTYVSYISWRYCRLRRILRLMDGLESRVSTVTQNGEMEALLFETMALPALQDELVAELLTSALHQQEEDVDFIEKQFRLFTGSLDDAR
ncbi:unnamed protein product [Symbiodinium microadriaticum]|nr:unnamed protein product [Symbiodinium microadriaticum]